MAADSQRKNLPLLILYLLAVCLLLISAISGLGQISRSYSDRSQRLISLFESQTADHLARGDVLAVSRYLNRFIASERIKCAYANRYEEHFFTWEPTGACSGLFAQTALIDWSSRGGIAIKLVLAPTLSELSSELITLFVQMVCLFGIVLIIYRATNLNKAYEIEAVELKNQIESVELQSKLQQETAIARTTQMLAHDVRKPFNLLRMTIERVKSAAHPEQMSTILNEALPEVDRSLASVNGLIADVLNVGGEGSLTLNPTRLAPVVEEVVDELRKLYPTHTLDVEFNLPTDVWIQADLTRLPRVFMNILSNAIEAVGTQKVRLWISAKQIVAGKDTNTQAVEIRVGNAGSFIAPEARDRLFDLFYTSGKSGGTGLGLAIVKKIVTQHGGSVVCTSEKNESFPEGQVEFIIRLNAAVPAAGIMEQAFNNPATQNEAAQSAPAHTTSDAHSKEDSPTTATKPHVVFLDDSPLVRWVWEAKLKTHTHIRCFAGPRELFESIEAGSVELHSLHTIITDHYFTPDERLTGLEVARELRQRGFAGRILLASNGAFSPSEIAGLVDKVVDKNPVEWELLNGTGRQADGL